MNNYIIMFDLDGTLIDSVPDICGALNRTLAKLDRRAHSVAEVASYLGSGSNLFMKKALKNTGSVPDEDTVANLTKQFLDDYAKDPVIDTVVFPGVFEALDELQNRGARLALCTNKPSAMVDPVLKLLKLDSYFETIVCGDHVENKKPHPDHILDTICSAGGDDKTPAIMIGDNVNDFRSAIDAGIPSIAVTFGYAQCAPEDLGASALIDHFDDLIPTIETVMTKY